MPFGHDLVWHNGQTLGHSALVLLSLDARLGVVMLANSPAADAMDSLAKAIMRHAYTIEYGHVQSKFDTSSVESLPGVGTSVAGKFVSVACLTTVTHRGDSYYATISNQKWRLDEIALGQYKVRLCLLGYVPLSNTELRAITIFARRVSGDSGIVSLIFIEKDGVKQFFASSVLPQKPPPIWLDRTGQYELVISLYDSKYLEIEPAVLTVHDDVYVVILSIDDQSVSCPLSFHGADVASLQGYGRMLGAALEFVQSDTFELMGLRFKRKSGSR